MLQQGVFVLCCSIILDYLVDCWYFIQCMFIFIIEVGYFIGQIEEKMFEFILYFKIFGMFGNFVYYRELKCK